MKLHKQVNEDAAGGAVGAGSVAVFAMPLLQAASTLKRQIPQQAIKVLKYGRKKKLKMNFFKKFNENAVVNETAAAGSVSANDIANVRMPLFSKTEISKKKKKMPKVLSLKLKETVDGMLKEEDDQHPDFDQTQVIGKLKSLEQKTKVDRDHSVTFGLEDENGNIVRVTVQAEQADEFEKALGAYLAGDDELEGEEGKMPEIAEILFKLRKHFNILDVKWPEVEEDQEQTTGVEGQPQPGAEGQPGAEQPGKEGGEEDLGDMLGDETGGEDKEVKSLLQQVIDMMKADAEARKAEAEARKEEAKNKAGVAVGKQEQAKVKHEEEILDMEEYEKKQKEEDSEAKKLAKLAKWKHDIAKEKGGLEGGEDIDFGLPEEGGEKEKPGKESTEDEETFKKVLRNKGKIHPSEVADFILKRVG